MDASLEILDELAAAGLVVSIVYGPCGDKGIRWSVDALSPTGESFDKPLAAEDFQMACQIAAIESVRRGWIQCAGPIGEIIAWKTTAT